ncbi:tetratricopeptide repeat protein [Methylococcus sp. EFPC2]|uniref:tetratricopeptide repeat protein n=1 Tax=Methylococcus sp. EFPC2 TaxID=2812648 RepID=UPI0019673774|nr:tetratricopeptide repeat protein [Methylococcus sp. EFPC2]QSA96568.1 tetratricopeptide repeat protein [Methylococcus sp. EFPC2]
MYRLGMMVCVVLLTACARGPEIRRTESLFRDPLFAPPTESIEAEDVFALSDDMKRFLDTEVAEQLRTKGRQLGLYEALYDRRQLKLDYDATYTRNAAEAFAARSGNCLSLVIMTGAFARAIGLPVQYQKVLGEVFWSRSDDLYFADWHVNIALAEGKLMTIDFVPPEEILSQRRQALREETVVAMFMNNRATEAITDGRIDDAYWWARAAIGQDAKFLTAYNTLGVIYRRHGHPEIAERVFAYALEQEPDNIQPMTNLAITLAELGRHEEARALQQKIEQLRPYPPFHFFDLGMAAMEKKDFHTAKDLFGKEIARDPYYHEFHFWLAAAYAGLGNTDDARKHLNLAIENSPTPSERKAYLAQLARLDDSAGRQ